MRIRVRFWPAVLLLSVAAALTTQAQTPPAQTPPGMSPTQPATTQPAVPPTTMKPTPPQAPATQPAAKSVGTQPTKPPPKAAKLEQPEGKAAALPPAPRTAEPKAAKPAEPKAAKAEPTTGEEKPAAPAEHAGEQLDLMSMVFVFMLATFLGIGIIRRVSRLLHTPLMSLTNAISAIAVVGSIMLAGGREYPVGYKIVGAVAIFASMTNIISGFLITDRMLKMFKSREGGKA